MFRLPLGIRTLTLPCAATAPQPTMSSWQGILCIRRVTATHFRAWFVSTGEE